MKSHEYIFQNAKKNFKDHQYHKSQQQLYRQPKLHDGYRMCGRYYITFRSIRCSPPGFLWGSCSPISSSL